MSRKKNARPPRAVRRKRVTPPAPPASAPELRRLDPGAPPVIGEDVIVRLAYGGESVGRDGRYIELSTRQARFVACLVPTMPNPCAREVIIAALWEAPPPEADTIVVMVAGELRTPLASIGLDLTRSAAGFALKKM